MLSEVIQVQKDKGHIFLFCLFVLFCFVFPFLNYCAGGVHYGSYKSSYNIPNVSYLNSSPPLFSLILASPYAWNSFNRSHFSIYIHVYTVFAPYSPSYILSPHPLSSHWYQPPRQDLFCPPVLQFKKNDIFVCLRQLYREFLCDISMYICIYVL
jgi:hypothetical protein